jgi:hypothetical protein
MKVTNDIRFFVTKMSDTYFPLLSLFVLELLLRFAIPGRIRLVIVDPFASRVVLCLNLVT